MRISKTGSRAKIQHGFMTEVVIADAATFLKMVSKNRRQIESVKFDTPKIGGKGFGCFDVHMKRKYY
ncbi:hypothetical protein ACNHJU_20675 [Klebsiella michiganensis]